MSIPPIEHRNGDAFLGYIPADEFEARVICVLEELIHGLAAVRSELSTLQVQVATNTEATARNANRIIEMVGRMSEITHETRIIMDVVNVARNDLEEAAMVIGMARDEIRAMTRADRTERPTDPDLHRSSSAPPSEP